MMPRGGDVAGPGLDAATDVAADAAAADVVVTNAAAALSVQPLCSGVGTGAVLVLDEPLSFWGGTDLATGEITDVHHPQRGLAVAGRVVAMAASRGSSSSSSVLAEQLRAGVGPAAIVITSGDAILALGALAASELYDISMPIVLIGSDKIAALSELAALSPDHTVTVRADSASAMIEMGTA
jgi:predicted aconitase with swiveling domain